MVSTEAGITNHNERIFIGLGSNLEPRLDYLRAAVTRLQTIGNVIHKSSIYETAPMGDISQPDFLNAIVEIGSSLTPLELVTRLKSFEKEIGRKDRPRWHEREIDLDLLFYGDRVLQSTELTIPHPEIPRRAFVLVPMSELDPNFLHPVLNKSVSELLRDVDETTVRRSPLTL
jgi:2-amino-4-hydroxy-6-hydroxymethyldihydropteridine diphosphokinase